LQVASLPRALRQTQCIQHGPGALDRLYRFIINALGIDPGSQSNKHSSRALRKQSCVAISGSKRGQVGDWSQFCYSLGKAAADSGYSMIATDAAGIGMSFCAGALDFLKSVETDDIPSRCRLIQVGTPDPAKRREIRHEFLKQVDACVFVGGGLGTREEYQILRQRGALCIPVGASGGTARKMWEELESYFHEHLYGQAFEAYARLGSIEYGIEDLVIATMQILGACLEGTVPEK
jgi:predicted Rossmann-fold nucleotide-binding protein